MTHLPPYWNDRYDFFRRHYPSTQDPPWPWPGTTTGYWIDAGSDVTMEITDTANLSATVEFNDIIDPSWPLEWAVVEGPGTVSFSSDTSYQTDAVFSTPGTYLLRFSAYDYQELASVGRFTSVTDQIEVVVNNNNIPPNVTFCQLTQLPSMAHLM